MLCYVHLPIKTCESIQQPRHSANLRTHVRIGDWGNSSDCVKVSINTCFRAGDLRGYPSWMSNIATGDS